jgi:DNA repair exonuclease SbcCD ATPase subunit
VQVLASSLQATAAELAALPLADFTAARNERARAARRGGDPALAASIAALPKATVSAWLVNLLVRERADLVRQLLDLGATLREAEGDFDPVNLRALTGQRRRLVIAVVKEVRALAESAGQHPSAAALEEVERTLMAALADAGAAEAVASGRLVRPLESVGLEPVDVEGAVAGDGLRAEHEEPQDEGVAHPEDVVARQRARRAAEAAERRAAEAEQHAERLAATAVEAEQEVARRTGESDDLRRELDGLRRRVEEVRHRLGIAENDLEEAEDALARARKASRAATREADEARAESDRARAAAGR